MCVCGVWILRSLQHVMLIMFSQSLLLGINSGMLVCRVEKGFIGLLGCLLEEAIANVTDAACRAQIKGLGSLEVDIITADAV